MKNATGQEFELTPLSTYEKVLLREVAEAVFKDKNLFVCDTIKYMHQDGTFQGAQLAGKYSRFYGFCAGTCWFKECYPQYDDEAMYWTQRPYAAYYKDVATGEAANHRIMLLLLFIEVNS